MLTPSKRIQDTVFLNSAVMLERMGYYGYRSILTLFLIQGMHMEKSDAFEWYAMLTVAIPLSRTVGGLCSDLLLGSKWSILVGGTAQAAGIALMSLGHEQFLLVGFVLLVAGNALFSPAVYARIGRSYHALPHQMDGAYTLTYCVLNLGAFLAPLTIGWIGEEIGFEIGFGAAAACMLAAGLAALILSGEEPPVPKESSKRTDTSVIALLAGGVFLIFMLYWTFYQLLNGTIQSQVSGENSAYGSTTFLMYSLIPAFFASVLFTVLWFFVKMNTFLKVGIGLLLSAIGAFLFLQFSDTSSAKQLFLVYAVMVGLGEVLVTPLLLSALAQYANPKYLGTLIGATSLFGWLLPTLIMKNGYELNGMIGLSWAWIGAAGLAIMGIVTLILVFALKGSARTNKQPS